MERMSVLFVGHGSPMNAIEDNCYTRTWKEIAMKIPRPRAILAVSAHWYKKDTRINNEEAPKTIHDMYGFPRELYEIIYDAPGSPDLAGLSKELISSDSSFDNSWGIDHGSWSVLVHMYPERDIPVFQISIDAAAPPKTHYNIGRELRSLRDQGVLIYGSGNIVHNLRMVDWTMADKGFDWAYEFDEFVYEKIMKKDHESILNYKEEGDIARLASLAAA
ncbi:MAG: 4,5-DOPA dioxygenase extradiol [Tissierellia bacterium]|nr:4,5-DOPA dioxygenase extradiol [Tissierellia bacterium]